MREFRRGFLVSALARLFRSDTFPRSAEMSCAARRRSLLRGVQLLDILLLRVEACAACELGPARPASLRGSVLRSELGHATTCRFHRFSARSFIASHWHFKRETIIFVLCQHKLGMRDTKISTPNERATARRRNIPFHQHLSRVTAAPLSFRAIKIQHFR